MLVLQVVQSNRIIMAVLIKMQHDVLPSTCLCVERAEGYSCKLMFHCTGVKSRFSL